MNKATVLAYCRNALSPEEIIELLNAITGCMAVDSPTCIALDKCIEALETVADDAAEAALWEADDRACGRAASLLPAFLIRSM